MKKLIVAVEGYGINYEMYDVKDMFVMVNLRALNHTLETYANETVLAII